MEVFRLHILAADRTFYDGDCVSLVIPTINGQYGVLAHHRNMVSTITTGELVLTKPDGEKIVAAVSGGLIKAEDNEVLALADSAEHPDEIDVNRAKKAADAAMEAMLQKKSIQDYKLAQAKMARAINRMKVQKGNVK